MEKENDFVQIIDQTLSPAVKRGLIQLILDDVPYVGRTIEINGRSLVNFGSCSYLGLETHPALINGTIEAVKKYGTQFSSSRIYTSAALYRDLEDNLSELFGAHAIVTPSTSLGHISALQVLVHSKDAVILDQHAHASVHLAANLLKPRGVPVEIIRHNNLNELEEKFLLFKNKGAHRVWYMFDGVYSMFGSLAPLEEILKLHKKHDTLYLYTDDAHGLSWTGKAGRGSVLGRIPFQDRMVVAGSLNKSFASAGGVLLFKDPELKRKVRTCGGTLLFSGPVQPPMLGAALASVNLHLSNELSPMQEDLSDKISYCTKLIQEKNIPLGSSDLSPIRFIEVGFQKVEYSLVDKLIKEGFYVNLAHFPAVPLKRSGIRITLNRHLLKNDIRSLIEAIDYHLPRSLEEESYTEMFSRNFPIYSQLKHLHASKNNLKVFLYRSIKDLDESEWNRLLGNRGAFDWQSLLALESIFQNNPEKESNWKFIYIIIKDNNNETILATFCTEALMKADMMSDASVSAKIEEQRKVDPYYFVSKTLSLGSFLTEGNHLFLDRKKDWKPALKLLISTLFDLHKSLNTEMILLRDFDNNDPELDAFFLNNEFIKIDIPDNHVFDIPPGFSFDEAYLKTVPTQYRRFIRYNVLKWAPYYETRIWDHRSPCLEKSEWKYFYDLYLSVKRHSLALNVFALPPDFFERILKFPNWEIMFLYLRHPENPHPEKPVAVCASVKTSETYSPIVGGLNYDFVENFCSYRQLLYQAILRGANLKVKKINLGFTSSLQKRRLGARAVSQVGYFHATDTYKQDVLSNLSIEANLKPN